MASKEEVKQKFKKGMKPTEQDFADLIDVAGSPGEKGADGKDGADGADGKSLTFDDLTEEQKAELKGDKGETGANGSDGKDGADGFGTEQQYSDIIARLDALEKDENPEE